ncbi:SRPBCC family protein [Isoptericola sp. NEAU-Y5]|uniref:SRPBCC family protein n=1 Tax=Isoptericola luteus TaxID=2879484 RepID=A0ABS7ZH58_9MICO|nr:SRPBCC family protein [Isoptericola sp. NEAU-Y5]MCA5894353.1 SRPBCC family protein [Isoptericola sp. NEAU-Y5]
MNDHEQSEGRDDDAAAGPRATGTVTTGREGRELLLTRTFRAPASDVWASLTEPDRMERWIGRWEGDPSTGRVTFFMTAEGDDVDPEEVRITRCEPPHRFAADTTTAGEVWHVRFDLDESGGVTTLTFRQLLGPEADPGSTGPGWEYYLDRLVAAREGRPTDAVPWDAYYPAMSEHYRRAADGA